MSKIILRFMLSAMLFAISFPADAQQAKTIPRMGYLSPGSPSSSPNREMFLRYAPRPGYC
jgi:hypothetical protein